MDAANLIYYTLLYAQVFLQITLYIVIIYVLLGPVKAVLIHLITLLSSYKPPNETNANLFFKKNSSKS